MDVVSLLHKADESSSHRNHVIVRVRGEDADPLREWRRRDGSCAVIGVRFSARPSGNGVLEVVENVDVDLVVRAMLFKQFSKSI